MYELFVLGELKTEPKHGYELQTILKNTVGPIRTISSGTLYPLISRLVKNGRISHHKENPENGRPRKIYEITENGNEHFLELMKKPLEYNTDTELIFHFKLTYFQYVTQDLQLECLQHYLEYLQYILKDVISSESLIISKKQIPEKKRIQILRLFDHRKHVTMADIEWAKKEIERIKKFNETF